MSSVRGGGATAILAEAADRPLPPAAAGGSPAGWLVASSPTVERLMRAGAAPVEPDDRLAAAAARMRGARVGALAVLESGRLVGLITERDLLLAVADGLSTDVTLVGAYMRPVPTVIGPDATASAAATTMIELRARHLPVVSDDQVVGLISASDLLCAWGVPRELVGDEPL